MVALGTNESSTQLLWSELVRTLPYLKRGTKNKALAPDDAPESGADNAPDSALDSEFDRAADFA